MRPLSRNPAPYRAGFTFLELLAVVVIILILAFLTYGVIARLPGKADRVRCTQNLKTIYLALNSYTEDNGHWPQQPPLAYDRQKEFEAFWMGTLKEYNVPDASWQCPGILRLGRIQKEGRSPKMHYFPTMFDSKVGTNKKWPNMPWVVEMTNAHGHGPLLILGDGSVHDWDTYMAQYMN